MSMRSVRSKAGLAAAAVIFTALAGASPAGATWRSAGATSSQGGQGLVSADIVYTGARTYNYSPGQAEDKCPPDGFGVSLKFQHIHGGGASSETPPKVIDTNGCDNGVEKGWGDVIKTNNIAQTRVTLCWTNNGDPCYITSLYSSWLNNPYV